MSLRPKKQSDGRANQLHKKRWVGMTNKMVQNIVLESMISIFGLTSLVNEADVAHNVSPLSKKEFRSIRRGARIKLGRAGFDAKTILTDEHLMYILESWGIEVK